jgi:hypothetical protein
MKGMGRVVEGQGRDSGRIVGVLGARKQGPPQRLRYHTSNRCPIATRYTSLKPMTEGWAWTLGYSQCRICQRLETKDS